MARSNGRDPAKNGRPSARRPRRRRILVVTNGEVTESEYCDLLNFKSVAAHIVCIANPVDPKQLASYAVSKKREDDRASKNKGGRGASEPYCAVFVVTDVDDTLPDNLRAAQRICKENSSKENPVRLIISNPCFEVWLIDHVMTCPDWVCIAKDAKDFAERRGLTTGRDNKHIVRNALADGIERAAANARKHNDADPGKDSKRQGLQTVDFAPWTDMPMLVQAME